MKKNKLSIFLGIFLFLAVGNSQGYTSNTKCSGCHESNAAAAVYHSNGSSSDIGYLQKAVIADAGQLTAAEVESSPIVDGIVDEQWSEAVAITIPLGETYDVHDPASITNCSGCHAFNSDVEVTLKAVYTSGRINFLAQWPNPTASFTRGNSWYWDENITDANKWNRNHHTEQSEDRMSFFFPIGDITGNPYDTGGCMSKCHMYYPTDLDPHVSSHGIVDDAWLADGRGDMWHSKAARGGAYLSAVGSDLVIDPETFEVTDGTLSMTGYADDKYVDEWADDSINGEDGGRYGDEGTSAYYHNRISDKSRPKYIETAPTDYADAMILTEDEIDGGEVAGDPVLGVSDAEAELYWPAYIALSAVVPERILRQPDGSRSDIDFGAVWSNGMWTAEFGRAMNTGNDDDIQFDPAQDYPFNIAAFENARHGYEHRTSQTYSLSFGPLIWANCVPGDLDESGAIDVLDIVRIVGIILGNVEPNGNDVCAGDLNSDGDIDVLDVVMIVGIILDIPQREITDQVNSAGIISEDQQVKLHADGTVAGIQMDVKGDFEITNTKMNPGWETYSNQNRVILFSLTGAALTSDVLFEYDGDMSVTSGFVTDWNYRRTSLNIRGIPEHFSLAQAYPNPFNPTTTITIGLPGDSHVRILVYDMLGRQVAELMNADQTAGVKKIVWRADDLPSGIYFIKMKADGFEKTQKVMLVK